MTAIVEAIDLVKEFDAGGGMLGKGKKVYAVSGVSFEVQRGETFAIVGESGCGKSTLARTLSRLIAPTSGDVLVQGTSVGALKGRGLRDLRSKIQFIFQDPFSSLNPRMSVGALIAEPMEVHRPDLNAKQRRAETAQLLRQVGLRAAHMDRYPHEFSGGQRQRIGIARALAAKPEILIGDEPVSALDVSVQAQVINLLADLKTEFGLTLIIVAHDLAVVRHMSDRIAVMYLGRIVEIGDADAITANPRHPYTQALMSAVPEARIDANRNPILLEGEIPSPINPPSGCRFRTRCAFAKAICAEKIPLLETTKDGREVACHFHKEIPVSDYGSETQALPEAAKRRFALFRGAVNARKENKTQQGEYQ
ncbi:dipeptide ABC transporter ATP-binding protein [Sulfitobacter sp. F26204]|uniref:ABC transporter ATP-binding protein n=1 Tax=Sulfitobacter sp. F26204 TaxID=2996014 RepID=UPI00225E3151|nr:dipeptide ABC transporter ATP-binding protein [Sulfitobacter sp. F26204]MCX7560674.1 dipeptide ABC transporter ATP-binding protein [Sulfitobacter sp. F26204]